MEAGKYRRRSTIAEAVQVTQANGPEIAEWCGGEWVTPAPGVGWVEVPETLGVTKAYIGHWVIKSLSEFYATDAGVFIQLYEPAGASVLPDTDARIVAGIRALAAIETLTRGGQK